MYIYNLLLAGHSVLVAYEKRQSIYIYIYSEYVMDDSDMSDIWVHAYIWYITVTHNVYLYI